MFRLMSYHLFVGIKALQIIEGREILFSNIHLYVKYCVKYMCVCIKEPPTTFNQRQRRKESEQEVEAENCIRLVIKKSKEMNKKNYNHYISKTYIHFGPFKMTIVMDFNLHIFFSLLQFLLVSYFVFSVLSILLEYL